MGYLQQIWSGHQMKGFANALLQSIIPNWLLDKQSERGTI